MYCSRFVVKCYPTVEDAVSSNIIQNIQIQKVYEKIRKEREERGARVGVALTPRSFTNAATDYYANCTLHPSPYCAWLKNGIRSTSHRMGARQIPGPLFEVLGLAAVVIPVASCNDEYFNETDAFYDFYRHKRSARRHIHEGGLIANAVGESHIGVTKKARPHHNNNHLQHPQHLEGHHPVINSTGECCPTVFEKIEPQGGSNQDGFLVELYQDHNYKQRFFELSCDPNFINRPCNFINRRNHQSKCVQKYSFTYALVKNTDANRTKHFPKFPVHEHGGATYTLDYIKVRSGCSCEVTLKKKRKKKNTKSHQEMDNT